MSTKSLYRAFTFRHFHRCYSADTKVKVQESGFQESEIPYRIHRGPTDILKALSSTLKKDFTAPKYKYADDPYLIPISNITKRSFALSKESGKKAARYFLEKYPELFKCNKSEPLIQAFEPPVKFTEEDNVTEETLNSCIKSYDVANCITVYEILSKKNISLTQKTKQLLLEILCFYNSTVPPRDEYYEERWFALKDKNNYKNTWLNGGLAEILFEDMEKDSSAYCAMIQGMGKYGETEKAMQLYEEMCEKKLSADLETYNSLLNIVPALKDSGDFRWELAIWLMKNMVSEKLTPNINTMNALLNITASTRWWNKNKDTAAQVLAEMKRLKIEPSLGTYFYLLVIFYRKTRHVSSILPQILNELTRKEFEIKDLNDTKFFYTAMEICREFYKDKNLGYQIHNILEYGNNCRFLSPSISESIYFQNFFRLLSMTEDFDKFMEIYEKYVPNTYTPEPSVMLDLLNALDFSGAYKHLPKFISDIVLFEQSEREEILNLLLSICSSVTLEKQDQDLLVRLIWEIMEKIDLRNTSTKRRNPIQWTGILLGDILTVCLNGNDFEKSWTLMQRLKNQESTIIGYPTEECLILFCQKFIERKEFDKVNFCVKYASVLSCQKIKNEIQKFVENLSTLEDTHRNEINLILEKLPDAKETKLKNENVE